jgi:hypothetical protein
VVLTVRYAESSVRGGRSATKREVHKVNVQEREEAEFGQSLVLWDADPDVCCAAFQLGACVHTEGGTEEADTEEESDFADWFWSDHSHDFDGISAAEIAEIRRLLP